MDLITVIPSLLAYRHRSFWVTALKSTHIKNDVFKSFLVLLGWIWASENL